MIYFLVMGAGALPAAGGWAGAAVAQDGSEFQPGYVLTARGDTVRGFVRAPTRSTAALPVAFRQRPDDKATQTNYPLRTLRGLGLHAGNTYVVRKLQPMLRRDTLRVLVQPLARGPLTLYRLDYDLRANDPSTPLEPVSYEFTFYFLEQGPNPLVQLRAATFRAVLGGLLQNCPGPKVAGRFEESHLVQLVTRYNACHAGPAPR